MAGHFIYYSNEIEKLSLQLSKILIKAPIGAFQQEIVLIPGTGMGNFLSLFIARFCGICSGIQFWFPTRFLKELLNLDLNAPFPFDANHTAWLLWHFLEKRKTETSLLPAFLRERIYETDHDIYIYSFANLMACVLDRCLLSSPEQIQAWQNEKSIPELNEERWQPAFWSSFLKEFPNLDINARIAEFFSKKNKTMLDSKRKKISDILQSPRIFVFGLSSFPPLVQNILFSLSEEKEIHWFFLQPGPNSIQEADKNKNFLLRCYDKIEPIFPENDIEKNIGNNIESSSEKRPLSYPKNCKKIHLSFQERQGKLEKETLLAVIQRSLYENKNGTDIFYKGQKKDFSKDASLSIHNCHSPLREVEILRDWLLDQLEKNPDLHPEDILVMSPQPQVYAPLVEAVFGNAQQEGCPLLPYKLRNSFSQENVSFTDIFFQLMALGQSRFTAADIFSIISNSFVSGQAGLSWAQVELIRKWIQSADIHWGADGTHRRLYGLDSEEKHTFSFGLLRLFFSYAVPQKREDIERNGIARNGIDRKGIEREGIPTGLSPVTEIEGEAAQTLGIFAALFYRLSHYAQKLRDKRSLASWGKLLLEMEEEILGTNRLTKILEKLRAIEVRDGFTIPVSIAPVQEYLENCLTDDAEQHTFPSQGITFSAFLPMRGVPFPVICLLGMNEGDFPRRDIAYEFDLLWESKNKGLRAKEDRCLFLEILLSVRSSLYISYAGQNLHRPKESRLASIVVQELLEYVDELWESNSASKESKLISKEIVYTHRSQGFSKEYFRSDTKEKLFSYSQQNYKAALALEETPQSPLPFYAPLKQNKSEKIQKKDLEKNLEKNKQNLKQIHLTDLLRFFSNPSKSWLRESLNFYLAAPSSKRYKGGVGEAELETEDPLGIDSLQSYTLRKHLIERLLVSDADKESLLEEAQSIASLPQGNYGQLLLEKIWEEAEAFTGRIQEYGLGKLFPLIEESFVIELAGALFLLGDMKAWSNTAGDLIYLHYGRFKGREQMKAWILHLIWQCLSKKKYAHKKSPKSFLVTNDNCIEFAGEASSGKEKTYSASAYLKDLVCFYQKGIEEPLAYFSEASSVYALAFAKDGPEKAFRAAQKKWLGYWGIPGEGDEPHIRLCFRRRDPFLDGGDTALEFCRLSTKILKAPLLYSQEVKK